MLLKARLFGSILGCGHGELTSSARRWLWGEPERGEESPHRVGHRAQDSARAGTAGTDQDLDREQVRRGRALRALTLSASWYELSYPMAAGSGNRPGSLRCPLSRIPRFPVINDMTYRYSLAIVPTGLTYAYA